MLPSPNGAALSLLAVACGIPYVFAGCLRNATAVASAVRQIGGTVTVIAALQPVIASPEALVAVAAFRSVASDLAKQFTACSSGQELWQRGLQQDIVVAAQLDASTVAPVLRGGAFVEFAPAGTVGQRVLDEASSAHVAGK